MPKRHKRRGGRKAPFCGTCKRDAIEFNGGLHCPVGIFVARIRHELRREIHVR